MITITPDSTENEKRIALAAAHRTVATIYDQRESPCLPLPKGPWHVGPAANVFAYFEHAEDIDLFADWVDNPSRGDSTSEFHSRYVVAGSKDDIAIEVIYSVHLTPDPLP